MIGEALDVNGSIVARRNQSGQWVLTDGTEKGTPMKALGVGIADRIIACIRCEEGVLLNKSSCRCRRSCRKFGSPTAYREMLYDPEGVCPKGKF